MTQTKLQELQEKARALKEEMRQHSKAALVEMFKDFFVNNPDVLAIRWQQYTPYFNDGDACTFSVYEAQICFDGYDHLAKLQAEADEKGIRNVHRYFDDEDLEHHLEDGVLLFLDRWGLSTGDENHKQTFGRLDKIFNFDDEFFEYAFGDHVRVTVTRDGEITVEDYDHE